MSEAIEILYQIYFAFVDWVFNAAFIVEGVSIGWIAVVVFVFSVMINSIINIARAGSSYSVTGHYSTVERMNRQISRDYNYYKRGR